jgi:hypothetical protein
MFDEKDDLELNEETIKDLDAENESEGVVGGLAIQGTAPCSTDSCECINKQTGGNP